MTEIGYRMRLTRCAGVLVFEQETTLTLGHQRSTGRVCPRTTGMIPATIHGSLARMPPAGRMLLGTRKDTSLSLTQLTVFLEVRSAPGPTLKTRRT